MSCACFIRMLHATPIPAPLRGSGERPWDNVTRSYDASPGRPGRQPPPANDLPAHGVIARLVTMMGKKAPGGVVGEWMCVLILSQRIERNKPRRGFPPARGGEDLFRYIEDN